MQAIIFSLKAPLTPAVGSKGQTSFSASSLAAYQIKGDKTFDNMLEYKNCHNINICC